MKLLRYPDLKAMGVVGSRMTLKRLIDTQGFSPGRMISPNVRAWTEDEVDGWIASRPTAREPDRTHRPQCETASVPRVAEAQ